MRNSFKKIIYLFSLLFLVFFLNKYIIYPTYVKWKWDTYTKVYAEHLDNLIIVDQKDPISLWDKVAYLEDKPSIHDSSYKEMIENFLSNKADYQLIRSINGFLLSNFIYDDFEDAITDLLSNAETNYVLSLWFYDESNGQYKIMNNNDKSIIEFIKRPSFQGSLNLYFLFDGMNNTSNTIDVYNFHKQLSSFSKEYFEKLANIQVSLNFCTAVSSSFNYYAAHPYHIKSGFTQKDDELFNNCMKDNYCWTYSK